MIFLDKSERFEYKDFRKRGSDPVERPSSDGNFSAYGVDERFESTGSGLTVKPLT
jgi:hypothetical protein